MRTIQVNLPAEPYSIHVESGLLKRAGELVGAVAPHDRAMVVADRNVAATHAADVIRSLEAAGIDVSVHELGAAESTKTLDAVTGIHDAMIRARLERKSPVLAVGGGITGDVAGFAAATFLRGVPLIHVPTTLLAMVDASIGGKTGVNHPLPDGGLGKNLIGAFWQPRAVLADPATLSTLDPADFQDGLAECVKHGIIDDESLLTYLEMNAEAILKLDAEVLDDLIERSASVKARIVAEDVREADQRALLNLGHTFAHALESIGELALSHGRAVAIGVHASMIAASRTGRIGNHADVERIVALLIRLGLPTTVDRALDIDRLMTAMAFDKKVESGRIRLVLPTALGSADVVANVPGDVIRDCWKAVLGAGRES